MSSSEWGVDTGGKSPKSASKLIQCGACFRSFHTQAQFGQHSRICREGKAVVRHLIQSEDYKYAFLEKQTKRKLEVKSRFVITIDQFKNWKSLSRKCGLYDGGIKKMLTSLHIDTVDVAIRQRKASGLIIANFMVRNVEQNAQALHAAKSSIQQAVDAVYARLPDNIEMSMHLCKASGCRELVIRDTEGFCSRHRAQRYHKKSNVKIGKQSTLIVNNKTVKRSQSRIPATDSTPSTVPTVTTMTKSESRGSSGMISKTSNIPPATTSRTGQVISKVVKKELTVTKCGSSNEANMDTVRMSTISESECKDDGHYSQLLNHLKATAPFNEMNAEPKVSRDDSYGNMKGLLSMIPMKNVSELTDNNDVLNRPSSRCPSIEDPQTLKTMCLNNGTAVTPMSRLPITKTTPEDDQIVAQILTNLRASCLSSKSKGEGTLSANGGSCDGSKINHFVIPSAPPAKRRKLNLEPLSPDTFSPPSPPTTPMCNTSGSALNATGTPFNFPLQTSNGTPNIAALNLPATINGLTTSAPTTAAAQQICLVPVINNVNGLNSLNGINGINGVNQTVVPLCNNGINGINGINGLNGVSYIPMQMAMPTVTTPSIPYAFIPVLPSLPQNAFPITTTANALNTTNNIAKPSLNNMANILNGQLNGQLTQLPTFTNEDAISQHSQSTDSSVVH